ncbi:MAG TPA: LuxR C-terminal-related transcriptional regulator [Gemmatimonadaceae bacterium]
MTEDDNESDRTLKLLLAGVLVLTIIGGAVDLILDAPDTLLSAHVIYEVVLIGISVTVLVVMWRGWFRARHDVIDMQHQLREQKAERDAWRASAENALAGFGQAIEERFRAWGLTPVESEIALYLLKGHSHKAIAFQTGRSEKTVRQHAGSIYHKARLGGRAELAAFFLEDVNLPEHGTHK